MARNITVQEAGRKGGKKGGPARAAKMTPVERAESARAAGRARWESMTKKQRDEHISRMVSARLRKKRRRD